jgi:hypothetical protein
VQILGHGCFGPVGGSLFGVAITAVQAQPRDPLSNASGILLREPQPRIQRGATAVLVGPVAPTAKRHRTVDRGDANRLSPLIPLTNRRVALAGRSAKAFSNKRRRNSPVAVCTHSSLSSMRCPPTRLPAPPSPDSHRNNPRSISSG